MFCAEAIAATSVVEPSPTDAPASADADDFRTVVEQRTDPQEDQRALDRDTPGFGTAIDLRTRNGAQPDDDLGEVLARTPGAHVRSLGGLGQFSAVSLRGSSSQQVGVFADGVPLTDTFGGMLNLADLPLAALDRVDVYRGFVPVRYGGATLGGAIDLHGGAQADAPRTRLATGLGSFGGRQLSVQSTIPLPRDLQLSLNAGYAGARGDFPFYDDASTPTFTGDDATVRRRNNDYDRVLGRVRLDGERGHVHAHVQQWALVRRSGIAGPIGAPSTAARLDTAALRTIAGVEHRAFGRPGGRLEGRVGLGLRTQRFDDPNAELGPGANDQRVRTVDLYASPRWRTPLWSGAFASVTADVRPEWVEVDERAQVGLADTDATGGRVGVGVGAQVEQFLADRRVRIVPAVRVDGLASRFDDGALDRRAEVGLSPRLGTRFRLPGPLEARASVGRYFRPPTLLELFGDRGYVVGNNDLTAERGTAVDGGFVLDHAGSRLSVYGQVAGFASWSEDLITWVSAGRVSRAVNLASARVRGVETAVQLDALERFGVEGSYTFTDAVDRSEDAVTRNQPLPGRPRHDATASAWVGRTWTPRGVTIEPRLRSGVDVTAGTRLDTAGRYVVPTRVLQRVAVELHVGGRIHWALEVRNLLDQRTGTVTLPVGDARPVPVAIGDYLGFPLPGRSVWSTVAIDFGDAAR